MPTGQQYATNVPQTTIPAGVLVGTVSWTVASSTGWPSTPFTAVLDIGTAIQEPVDVGTVAGANWSGITRAIDSTTAFAHGANCTVTFAATGRDFREARSHIDASTNVHGLTGGAAVVGDTQTQTLTNKTLTSPTINTPSVTQATFTAGAAATPVTINGAAAQSADIFDVTAFGSSNPSIRVDNAGRTVHFAPATTQTALTVFGLTNQTADILAVEDASTTKLVRVAANDATGAGATVIQPTDTSNVSFLVNSPNGITTDSVEFGINSSKKWSVTSTGNFAATNSVQLDLTGGNTTIPIVGPAWQTYAVAWAGGTVAIGNGTLTSYWQQIGKTVYFRIRLTGGTTTNWGGASNWTFSLPTTARTTSANETMGMCHGVANHAGSAVHLTTAIIPSGATVVGGSAPFSLFTPANTGQGLNSTTPFTWVSTDNLFLSGYYETA